MGSKAGRALTAPRAHRPRRRLGRFFLAAPAALLFGATPAFAQDPPPPPPDTIVVDTLAPPPVPADSPMAAVPLASPRDTLPPPRFVRLPEARPAGPAAGVWRWDRAALLAETVLSLADLVEQLPGTRVIRVGTYLQPELAQAFGGTADRIEVIRDGFVIDPLGASSIDLSKIRLANLAEVVIERRLDVLRIHLRTDEAETRQPYSRVEAAVGQPPLNVFRGLLLAPRFAFGPFAAAVERIETDGRRGNEPADVFETWLKWGWASSAAGVQGELRRFTLSRRPQSPWPLREERSELVLRGRAAPLDGLGLEAYWGRTAGEWVFPEIADTATRRTGQFGGRAAYLAGPLAARGAIRGRSHEALPRLQADLGVGYAIGGLGLVDAELTHSTWRLGPGRTGFRVHASATPVPAIRIFGEFADGERAAPRFLPLHVPESGDDPEPTAPVPVALPPAGSNRSAVRLGAELDWRGLRGGAAALRIETDSVPAWGMPFDSAIALLPGGTVNGVEAWGRIPLFRTPFSVEGSVVNYYSGDVWPYLARLTWRTALRLDWSPLESGNLDIRGRVEARHRGDFIAPTADLEDPLAVLPATTGFTASLMIRVIDVHIFGRYEDVADRVLADLPGRPPPGARFFYGVKWNFWN